MIRALANASVERDARIAFWATGPACGRNRFVAWAAPSSVSGSAVVGAFVAVPADVAGAEASQARAHMQRHAHVLAQPAFYARLPGVANCARRVSFVGLVGEA